jgi:hypothetical protein
MATSSTFAKVLLPPLGEGWDGGVCLCENTPAAAPTPTLPQRGREPVLREHA